MKHEKVNPWFIVSILLFVVLVGGTFYHGWIRMHDSRELQTAVDGTRRAEVKVSQIEFALGNIIDRSIQQSEENRGLESDILGLQRNRRKSNQKIGELESIIIGQQRGITECIGIVGECIQGLERSRGYLEGNAE